MRIAKRQILVILMLIISLISLALALSASSFAKLSAVSGKVYEYDGAIDVYVDGEYRGKSFAPLSLNGLRPFAHVTFSLSVPSYVEDGDYVAIRKNSAKFNVFLDSDLIFSYFPDAKEEGRPEYGYGTTFYIPLGEDSAGKNLRLDAIEAPNVDGISLAYIEFGDPASMELRSLFWELDMIIVSYILFFMAIIAIASSFFSREKETRESLISSAFLLIIMALWLFFQSRSRQYIIHNTVLPATVSYFCIFFFPYVLYCYFLYNYPLKDKKGLKIFHFASLIFIASYLVIGVLSFIGIYGFSDALTVVTAFVLVFTASLFVYVFYLFFKKKEKVGIFLIVVSPMMISFLIEWILLLLGVNINTSITLEVLAFSTVAILFKSLSLYLLETKERAQKEAVLMLAYQDPLTGLRNRGSYEAMINQTWHGERFLDVYVIDVNNLKLINDREGHFAGNTLIKSVSDAIIRTFPYFKQLCYRTGGDEFVLFSPSGLGASPDTQVKILKEILRDEHGSDVISIGYVSIDTKKIRLKDAVAMADAEMYEDKKSGKNS